MGTNYYLKPKAPCATCGHQDELLHIGKSSAGWAFSLHVIPERGINSLDDWMDLWTAAGSVIENEYGEVVSEDEMKDCVVNRGHRNGLSRGVPGEWDCVGNGPGTWDLYEREFC